MQPHAHTTEIDHGHAQVGDNQVVFAIEGMTPSTVETPTRLLDYAAAYFDLLEAVAATRGGLKLTGINVINKCAGIACIASNPDLLRLAVDTTNEWLANPGRKPPRGLQGKIDRCRKTARRFGHRAEVHVGPGWQREVGTPPPDQYLWSGDTIQATLEGLHLPDTIIICLSDGSKHSVQVSDAQAEKLRGRVDFGKEPTYLELDILGRFDTSRRKLVEITAIRALRVLEPAEPEQILSEWESFFSGAEYIR